MFNLWWKNRRKKKRIWVMTDSATNQYVAVIDCEDIAAINIPDINQDGCDITLKCGVVIHFHWKAEFRDKNIGFILDELTKE